MEAITTMTDSAWRGRVEQAKRDYVRLRRAISELYRTTVVRSGDYCEIPLWKLAFVHHNDKIPELVEDNNLSMAKNIFSMLVR